MPSLGVTTLARLKAFVLPASFAADTAHDATLTAIAAGVLAAMERLMGRKLTRVAGDTYTEAAGKTTYILPRYPVETLTALDVKWAYGDAWETGITLISGYDEATGIVRFPVAIGTDTARFRFTFTGGFWINASDDAENPDTKPDGATEMPGDIVLAFLQQCGATFAGNEQAMRQGFRPDASAGADEYLPQFLECCRTYRRMVV